MNDNPGSYLAPPSMDLYAIENLIAYGLSPNHPVQSNKWGGDAPTSLPVTEAHEGSLDDAA